MPGGERFWHHLVRLNPAAMIGLVDDRDQVLLMWRHRFAAGRWGFELPGGVVEAGEDPVETAVCELAEETRLPGGPRGAPGHVRADERDAGLGAFGLHRPRSATLRASADESEEDRVGWVPLADAPGLIAAGKIWSGGTLVALLGLMAL